MNRSGRHFRFLLIALITIIPLFWGCSSEDDDPPPPPVNQPPSAAVTTPSTTQSGDVTISYILTDGEGDTCTIAAEYTTDGSTWTAATAGSGGDGTSGLTSSSSGTAHSFVWDSVVDAVALASAVATVQFRITPSDGVAGAAESTNAFTVNNNTPPVATVTTPSGTQTGNVTISYALTDPDSHAASVTVEFSTDGSTYATAASAGGDGLTGLTTSPTGTVHTFIWNSAFDGVGTSVAETAVTILITPSDAEPGTAGTSGSFTVNNTGNTPPSVTVTTPSGSQSGAVSITYYLIDAESNACSIAVEFSTDAGGNWSPATAGAGGDGLNGLASSISPGTAHTYVWNSITDNVGVLSVANFVRIRITPSDTATGTPGSTSNFTVNNTGNTAPTAAVATPSSTQSGIVPLSYTLTDVESNQCSITAEFSADGGGTWGGATQGPGGDGTTGLASSPSGTAHVFVWNSFADAVGTVSANASVRFRITPNDGLVGTVGTTSGFTVDNTSSASGASVGSPFPILSNPVTGGSDRLMAMATDGQSLYLGGRQAAGGAYATGLARVEKRRLYDGALEASFGTGGVLSIDPSTSGDDEVCALAVYGQNLYVGIIEFVSSTNRIWRVEKRTLASGALVTGFGTSGAVTNSLPGDTPGFRIAIDGTNMYLPGAAEATAGSFDFEKRIEKRSLGSGNLQNSFGSSGVVTYNHSANADAYFQAFISGSNIYLAGGYDFTGAAGSNAKATIERRNTVSGNLDTSFGTSGYITVDSSAGNDIATGLGQDGTNIYVLILSETALNSAVYGWIPQKRSLSSGSLLSTGTSTAAATASTSAELPVNGAVWIDGAGVYICGPDGTDRRWRAEKRLASDLSLAGGFATAGVFTVNPSVGSGNSFRDDSTSMVLSNGVLFLGGFDCTGSGSDPEWRLEALFK